MVLLRVVHARTSSTKRITGSRLGSGVLNSLSSRLDACSGVAFCPVSSCGYREKTLVKIHSSRRLSEVSLNKKKLFSSETGVLRRVGSKTVRNLVFTSRDYKVDWPQKG